MQIVVRNVPTGVIYDFVDEHVGFNTNDETRVKCTPTEVSGISVVTIEVTDVLDPLLLAARSYFQNYAIDDYD